jgi:hypothetical protein
MTPCFLCAEAQSLRDDKLCLQFKIRSAGVSETLEVLCLGCLTISLRNVARHGNRGPSQLVCQTKTLRRRKLRRESINRQTRLDGPLPYYEVPKRSTQERTSQCLTHQSLIPNAYCLIPSSSLFPDLIRQSEPADLHQWLVSRRPDMQAFHPGGSGDAMRFRRPDKHAGRGDVESNGQGVT